MVSWIAGCGVLSQPVDPLRMFTEPLLVSVVGGFWELSLENDSLTANSQQLPSPFDQILERAIRDIEKTFAADDSHRRLFFEITSDSKVFIHDYDLFAATGTKSLTGDIYLDIVQPPEDKIDIPTDPTERYDTLAVERPFWLEKGPLNKIVIVFAQRPFISHAGDWVIVVQPVFRIHDITFQEIRVNIDLNVFIVAKEDFPYVPPLRYMKMQKGETFAVKVVADFELNRCKTPFELRFINPLEVEGGIETIFPLGKMLQTAIYGD